MKWLSAYLLLSLAIALAFRLPYLNLKPFHGDAPLKNLRKIRELGIGLWARCREKCYPWL